MGFLDLFKRKVTTVANENIVDIFYNHKTEEAYTLFYDDSANRNKMKLPKSIVNTIVDSASQEFDFNVTSDSKELQRICKYLKNNIRIAESHLCIGGQLAFKPYIKNNKVGVSVYGGRDFVAYYDEFGDVEKVYFKSNIRVSDIKGYVLVEIHTYDSINRLYRIDNQLYEDVNTDWNRKYGKMAQSLGARVPLSKCDKTRELDEFIIIEDVDKHLCSVVNLDNSMTYNKGRSIYESSFGLIADAEKQYQSLLWEYSGGELGIDAPAELFRVSGSSSKKAYSMPEGKERLYRRLEGAPADFDIKVFAPTLRDESYIRGLNEILKKIERNCGLYSGALASVEHDEKTATEVISSKQRFYVTVMDIKNRLKVGIEDIIHSCCVINNRMLPEFMKENITVNFEIGDSVIDVVVDTIQE